MPIKYFATNRRRDDLAGLIRAKKKGWVPNKHKPLHRSLLRGGYYFVDMEAYMNAFLETTEQEEMPAAAVVEDSGTDVFADFLEQDGIERIIVCVHGFNVELSGALDWYGVLMASLQNQGAKLAFSKADLTGNSAVKKTAVIGFSWPSNGRVIDYLSDQRDASQSTPAFCSLLARLKLTGKPVSLICHSMGNYMAGFALSALASGAQHPQVLAKPAAGRAQLAATLSAQLDKAQSGKKAPWIDTMVMLAPDVERRHVSLCTDDRGDPSYEGPFYHGLNTLVGRSVNVFSRYDGALNVSNIEKSVREGAHGVLSFMTAGLLDYSKRNPDLKWERRLGLGQHPSNGPSGMESLNAAEIAARPVDHGDHVDSPAIAAELKKILF